MNKSELFIAKRLYFANNGERKMSRPAVRVALFGIIIGMVVMIVTIFVVIGFKKTVSDKVIGFNSHIQVVNFDNNNTYELQPINVNDTLMNKIKGLKGVRSAELFATKPGIIKTDDAFQGIVIKGLTLPQQTEENSSILQEEKANSHAATPAQSAEISDAWQFFAENMTEGRLPQKPNEVIISTDLAKSLHLKADTSFLCYFIQDNIRVRKFHITGLYCTDFADFDNLFILGDLAQVQTLNEWDSTQVSGIDVRIHNFKEIMEVYDRVYFATANRFDAEGNGLYAQNIVDQNPAIFKWLDLLDMNVIVIILLMLAVSGFNIISGLLILILDSIQLIGTLKALGACNKYIRKIFLYQATMLVGKGMIYGNIIGLTLCALQYWLHIIPLDPSVYYVSYVPITFGWLWWAVLNIGTLLVSFLILLGPSLIITKISPAKVMHFE